MAALRALLNTISKKKEPTQQVPEDLHTDLYGNESRTLLGNDAAFQRPWHKDKRPWVRWPAQVWRATGQRLVPRAQGLEFRPASNWWSRHLGSLWRNLQRTRGLDNLFRLLTQSYLNFLLVFLPLALASILIPLRSDIIFTFNFLAIIPLSSLAQSACEGFSLSLSPTSGKLLVAFSDNIIELVVGVVALCKGEIYLVQVTMIGSVLCYSLLIMGSCFIGHGMRYSDGRFNDFRTNRITSLNAIAMSCLLIPSTLHMLLKTQNSTASDHLILIISRIIAVILLILYMLYLTASLRTHRALLDFEEDEDEDERGNSADAAADLWLGPIAASIWFTLSLALLSLCTVALISSLQESSWKGKKPFIGVALLNQLDITILATTGSSMQLLLFNLPVLVISGWIINEPMTLSLQFFETSTVFLGVFVVRYVVVGGKSNYLCGAICIALYTIIALAAFLEPSDLALHVPP